MSGTTNTEQHRFQYPDRIFEVLPPVSWRTAQGDVQQESYQERVYKSGCRYGSVQAVVTVVDADITSPAPAAQFNTVQVIDFQTLAAMGKITGAQAWYKIGSSEVIPTATFMILSNVTSSTFISNFPTVPQQLRVVSTSANDAAAGTGAQQATIEYLTDPGSPTLFTRFSEIVTLNGTTPVNTVATNISRIERVHVSRVGSTSVSQGDISIQSVGGATTFEKIAGGENVSRTAVHFVPNGYMSIITDLLFGTSTSGGTRFAFTSVEQDPSGNIVRVGELENALNVSTSTLPLNTPIVLKNNLNKRLSFAVTVRGMASNQQGSASFIAIDIPI